MISHYNSLMHFHPIPRPFMTCFRLTNYANLAFALLRLGCILPLLKRNVSEKDAQKFVDRTLLLGKACLSLAVFRSVLIIMALFLKFIPAFRAFTLLGVAVLYVFGERKVIEVFEKIRSSSSRST